MDNIPEFIKCNFCGKPLSSEEIKAYHVKCDKCFYKPIKCKCGKDMKLDQRGVRIYGKWITSAWYCPTCQKQLTGNKKVKNKKNRCRVWRLLLQNIRQKFKKGVNK